MNTHRAWKSYIKEVDDFPKEGISFKDISPLLGDEQAFRSSVVCMGDLTDSAFNKPDVWIGIDARGFLFAGALACYFGGGVVMCRKKGKLPPPTIDETYNTEYSYDFISIKEGSGSAIIVDDVLATGGTLEATNRVAGLAGYDVVDNVVLIDLKYVPRIDNFDIDVKSVVSYE
tara:strand:- start:1115 stop:1633 length:519 start_codon:yes stop_codon:yes gene_type:complete